MVTTSIVGFKVIFELVEQKRLSKLPDVIYLDSAHEMDETFIELIVAWKTLKPGGVLFGDDWNWKAVEHDVSRFASLHNKTLDIERMASIHALNPNCNLVGVVTLCDLQWILVKR